METNQLKVVKIIGESMYKELIDSGFVVIEKDNFEKFMNHEERIQTLAEQLAILESSL